MNSKLVVDDVELGFMDSLPISTNFAVADIREPDKRNATFTKTITIPATKQANEVFEYCFDLNLAAQTFNPNLSVTAKYYVNEKLVVDGKLQLLNITSKFNGNFLQHLYNCAIVGETGDLFVDISNKFLTDIDFSTFDHILDKPTVFGSWSPTLGQGFVYPYIDYGVHGGNSTNWYLEALKPAIFELEYIKRIFADAGYTFTSNYLNSTYSKSILIPSVDEGPLKLTNADIQNNQFLAGNTTTVSCSVSGNFISGSGAWSYGNTITILAQPVQFSDDSTPPYNDPGNIYNTSTFIYTTGINTAQTIVFNLLASLFIVLPATGVTVQGVQNMAINIETLVGGTWIVAATTNFAYSVPSPITPGAIPFISVQTQIPGNYYQSGRQFRCSIVNNGPSTWIIRNSGGVVVTSGSSTFVLTYSSGGSSSQFYSVLASTDIGYGGQVIMNDTIPKNVRQVDFLRSIIACENLYVELDKNNPRNYIIEPREDFIQYNSALDWSKKLDVSNDIVTLPMGDLDAKRYLWSYKSDKDTYNSLYEDKFKEVYGNKIFNVTNDFIKPDKSIDVVFSATPGVSIQTDIVAPRLYTVNSGQIKPLKCNIRRLYWGGLKQCNKHILWIDNIANPNSLYPYCGHVDDPNTPTIDLCFDNPKEMYWIRSNQTYTNNNLFNRGYSKLIQEITDPGSKIVQCKMYLDESDINKFSFRKIIFIEMASSGAYFFVNKIENYDPQVRKVCDVELLKLNKGVIFSPVNYPPGNPPPGGNTSFVRFVTPDFNPTGIYGNSRTLAVGLNTVANGQDNLLVGNNAFIGEGAEDVQALGFTGNVDALTYNGKFAARNGAFIIGDAGVNTLKHDRKVMTVDFTVDDTVQLYFADCSGGNITVTMPSMDLNNSEYSIVRIDDTANTLTVVGILGSENFYSTGVTATSDTVPGLTTRRYSTNYNGWFY